MNFSLFATFRFIYYFCVFIFIIFFWGILTEIIWEFLTFIFKIQTAKRNNKKVLLNAEILGLHKDLIDFVTHSEEIKGSLRISTSNRWKIITLELPLIIGLLAFTLFPFLGPNLVIIFLLDIYLFFFLFFSPIYLSIIFRSNSIQTYIKKINSKLFGQFDISDYNSIDSLIISCVLAFLFLVIYYTALPYFQIFDFFLLLLIIGDFILTIRKKGSSKKTLDVDLETKYIVNQLKNMNKIANIPELVNQNFYFSYENLIQKIIPVPFDKINWVVFSFKNRLFNPMVLQQLGYLVDININIHEFFKSDLLQSIDHLSLQSWDEFPTDREIYDKFVQLYDFDVSIFQKKTENRIFFFNFKDSFLLCDHSVHPLIVDQFMVYFEQFLKKKLFSSFIVDSFPEKAEFNLIMDENPDLIYWNLTDIFLARRINEDPYFLINQKKNRRKWLKLDKEQIN